MRLDQFLKLSRIIKQRSVAKSACESGRVEISGRNAKAGTEVRPGDEITVDFRDGLLMVRVREIPSGKVSKSAAPDLYEVLEDRRAG